MEVAFISVMCFLIYFSISAYNEVEDDEFDKTATIIMFSPLYMVAAIYVYYKFM